jgi:hypothetical protein
MEREKLSTKGGGHMDEGRLMVGVGVEHSFW